ncbi:MAG: hypothetical protein D6744_01720 [Planctomycetota bacterium]|nr:MAG: hypothetical protein D6744_01720 [Planctomycetota bacterium]
MPGNTRPREKELWERALHRPAEEAVPADCPGRWWVAHTKPRSEKALALDLERRRIPYYLPLRRRTTHSRATGRASHSIVPVFTGYVFFNAVEQQRIQALTTNRIVSTLEVVDQQRLVFELRQIQRVICTDSEFEWGERLEVGDWVRVIAGPLMGVEGVVRGRRSRARLVLNVQMLAQSVQLEVERSLLERIDPPSFHSAR